MHDLHYEWLIPERVALVQISGALAGHSFVDVDNIIVQTFLNNSSLDQVHVIFDNRQLRTIPPMSVYHHVKFTSHERLGWILSYGDNALTGFFIMTLGRKKNLYIQTMPSQAACMEFLLEMDPSLESMIAST